MQDPRADTRISNIITQDEIFVDFTFPIIQEDATEAKSTVQMAEERKKNFYRTNYGMDVTVGAIDTYGRWGPDFVAFVVRMARAGSAGNWEYATKLNHMRTAIAVTHVRALGRQMKNFLSRNAF